MDPDPAIFVIDLQDTNKNYFFSAFYFLKVHLHQFSKLKSRKEVQKIGIKVFLLFLFDDRRIWIRIRTSD